MRVGRISNGYTIDIEINSKKFILDLFFNIV